LLLQKPQLIAAAKAYAASVARTPEAARLCEKSLDLVRGERSIVIGTLYKEMKLKPCILDEYAKEVRSVPTGRSRTFSCALIAVHLFSVCAVARC
jgi:hypothetical protein